MDGAVAACLKATLKQQTTLNPWETELLWQHFVPWEDLLIFWGAPTVKGEW